MNSLYELFIRISADTADYDKKLTAASAKIERFGDQMSNIGSRLSMAITLPMVGLGAAALKVAGDMESAKVGFTTMMKSEIEAEKHLKGLRDFALTTPFQFGELTQASRLMQAMGFAAQDVIPKLRTIGDAVSALGGGPEVLERVVRSIGEIGTAGKISGEQLRELSRAGIPALEAIAKKLGVTVAEARVQVTAQAVDAKTALDAIFTYMTSRFGGGMEAQAKTIKGMVSNLKDAITFTLADIGAVIAPFAKTVITDMIQPLLDKTKALAGDFARLSPEVQKLALAFGFIAAAGPPLLWVMGSLVSNSALLFAAFTKVSGGVGALYVSLTASLIPAIGSATYAVWNGLIPALTAAEAKLLAFGGKIAILAAAFVLFKGAVSAFDGASNLISVLTPKTESNLQRIAYAVGGASPQGTGVRLALQWATTAVRDFKAEWDKIKWMDMLGPLNMIGPMLTRIATLIEHATGKYKSMDDAQKSVVANLSKIPGVDLSPKPSIYNPPPAGAPGDDKEAERMRKEMADAYARSHLAFDEYSLSVNKSARAVQDAWTWQQLLNGEFTAFGATIPDVTGKITDYSKVWAGPALANAPNQVEEITKAFARQGVVSQAAIDAIAANAVHDYEVVQKSGIYTMAEITRFWLASERAQIAASLAKGDAVSESYKQTLNQIEMDLNNSLNVQGAAVAKTASSTESAWKVMGALTKKTLNDLSKNIADLIVDGGKFKDVIAGIGKEFEKALIRMAINAQLERMLGLFKNLITEGGTLGKVLGVIFGSGGSAASTAGGTAKTAGGAAGSAGGSAGAIGGAASSGIMGTIGAIASVGTLISSIIGNFQNARQENTLNAIEWNTRYTSLTLQGVHDMADQWWPKLYNIDQYNWTVQGVYLQKICAAVENIDKNSYGGKAAVTSSGLKMAPAGASSVTATINVNGATDARAVAKEVMSALRRAAPSVAYA